jgi:hypothetical protein
VRTVGFGLEYVVAGRNWIGILPVTL